MTDLIDLAHRKNAAHRALLEARARIRYPAGYNKMTEADRNISMDAMTSELREEWENLADEWTSSTSGYETGGSKPGIGAPNTSE